MAPHAAALRLIAGSLGLAVLAAGCSPAAAGSSPDRQPGSQAGSAAQPPAAEVARPLASNPGQAAAQEAQRAASAPSAETPLPPPTSTPSPAPQARLWQLTRSGCCVQPFWSPDGGQVRFLDKPSPEAPVGIYGVAVEGGEPALFTTRLGIYSPDGRFTVFPEGGRTYIEESGAGGARWPSPSGSLPAAFTPDGEHVWWQQTSSGNFDRRITEVWMARPDGSQARRLVRLSGGGVSDWFPGGDRLLVSHRERPGAESVLSVLRLEDGSTVELARAPRIRNALVSPAGGWVAYQVTFSGDAQLDGMWVVSAEGGERRRLEVFGAYRWRGEGRLLVIPLEADPATGSHRVVEVEAASGRVFELTQPAQLPFRIAAGDWSVSPDGERIAFVSAADRGIWILELPPSPGG